MKKLFVSFALFSVTLGAFAQGSISFANRSSIGKGVFIYGTSAANPSAVAQGSAADYSDRSKLTGATYVAALFAEVNGVWNQISPLSAFRTTAADAGLLAATGKINPDGFIPDSKVNLILRAWDARAATWADVIKPENDGLARGESLVIKDYVVGAGNGFPSTTVQKSLIDAGLQSFGLYVVVPEPSVMALGALGIGALLLRRRK